MRDELWISTFAAKITTAREAVALIGSGRRILVGSGAAEPVSLVEALLVHGDPRADNEIVHPDIPELIRSRSIPVDVALIQTSPPDVHGYVSLGVAVDVVRAAVDMATLVLAEINPRMPRTHGDSLLHVSKIDRLVPVDTPLLEVACAAPDDAEAAIGHHVATLVPNSATIQTGIGAIPDAVLSSLSHHQDLGVHTEMLSDGFMALARAGVITGARKSLLRGKMVTSLVAGSRALYEWVHENSSIEMRGSDFTNDPRVIARNDHMVSINSARAVDLTGQIAADTSMGTFSSGIGGQASFVRGAAGSRGGRSIIALRSTTRDGSVSRICAALPEGAGVAPSRGYVRYVVTEYGVADLLGKSVRDRALALVEIAHPDFRSELLAQAKGRRYVSGSQHAPRAVCPWPEERHGRTRGCAQASEKDLVEFAEAVRKYGPLCQVGSMHG